MIKKGPHKRSGSVQLTFTIPVEEVGMPVGWLDGGLSVVGDFNDWDPLTNPFIRRAGVYRASVTVQAGERHVFRYLAAGGRWFNDPDADGYQVNAFGSRDSIVDVTQIG